VAWSAPARGNAWCQDGMGLTSQELDRDLRKRGAIIMGIIGLVWALAGSAGFTNDMARVALLVVAVAVTVFIVLLGLRVGRQPARERPRQLPENWNQRYGQVGMAQGAAIGVAVLVLILAGWTALIPAVVCLIVGVHFFPLASIFDQHQYWWTGLALCLVAGAGFAILALAGRDASIAVTGLGAAITLWATAGHVARYS
jgi:hypothetical protein